MKKKLARLAFAVFAFTALLGTAGTANATVITQNFGPFNNVDTNPPSHFNFFATGPGTMTDLNVALRFIDPSGGNIWPSDLRIRLSHLGTNVILALNNLGSNQPSPVTYFFDDDGGPGTTVPISPLSAFDGLAYAGVWRISFLDTVFPGEHDRVRLRLRAETVPEPGTLALIGAGLAGIGVARRRRKLA